MGQSNTPALPPGAPWWAVLLDHVILAAVVAVPILLAHRQGASVVNGSLPKLIDALKNSIPVINGKPVTPQPVESGPQPPAQPEPPNNG